MKRNQGCRARHFCLNFFLPVLCIHILSCATLPLPALQPIKRGGSSHVSHYWRNELKSYHLFDLSSSLNHETSRDEKQLAYPCAVIVDPGHGGEDTGSIGRGGIKEKELVLNLSRLLERELKGNLSCQIVLTRRNDRKVSLEKRALIASRYQNAVLISIHANAHPQSHFHGIETYYFSPTSDEEALTLAMRENRGNRMELGEVQWIVRDLEMRARGEFGRDLASVIDPELSLFARELNVRNRGLKGAPFFVLAESAIPSILVEVGFLTHPLEASRLADPSYQERFAQALARGLKNYFQIRLARW